ncbi:MAG: hypothetical protein COC02_03375, partial [Rhodospirillaceae bacterium]
MKRVWSDENKYGKWLLIELAVCEAWSDEGVVPPEDMEKLRRHVFERMRGGKSQSPYIPAVPASSTYLLFGGPILRVVLHDLAQTGTAGEAAKRAFQRNRF